MQNSHSCTITLEAKCKFKNDSASKKGGITVLSSFSSTITIEAGKFHDNSATDQGGVLASSESNITIKASGFHNNNGGVLLDFFSNITIGGSNFTNNVSPVIIVTTRSKIQHEHTYLLIDDNMASDRDYGAMFLSDSEFVGCDSENDFIFLNNLGPLGAFNSNITFTGYATFVNNYNSPSQIASGDIQERSTIVLFQSNVFWMEYAILNTTMLKMVEQYILLR